MAWLHPYRAFSLLVIIAMSGIPSLSTPVYSAPSKNIQTLYHFGEQKLTFPLDHGYLQCQKVRSQLFKRIDTVSVPVSEITSTSCNKPITVELPKVESAATYMLIIELQAGGHWDHIKTHKIQIYPKDIFNGLRQWSKRNKLLVSDSEGKLEAFFKEKRISFESTFGFATPHPTALMKVGEREYLFRESNPPFPKVVIEKNKVTFDLPVLDTLKTNPVVQWELMQLIQQDIRTGGSHTN